MSIQTDVRASNVLTATGNFLPLINPSFGTQTLGRVRIKSIYVVGSDVEGSCIFRDGTDQGPTLLTLNVPAAVVSGSNQALHFVLPENGILAVRDVHVTMTSVTSVMITYG
jgi:hypothetical protein